MIYTDQQLQDIFFHLQKGECPVKYIYINEEGANARASIEQENPGYQDSQILEKSISTYLHELGNGKEIALFDFGCGIGNTIKSTLQYLLTNGYTLHYHAFDISQEIIEKCRKNLLGIIPQLNFQYTIIDFETTNLTNMMFQIRKNYNNIPVLGLFLGNTVGNFSSMERVISNIMESLRIEDKLVIGLQRVDLTSKRWLEHTIKNYEKPIIYKIFFSTLKYLGLRTSQGKYYVEFNYRNNSIECYFEFERDTLIKCKDINITIQVGERVCIGKSTKIDEANFTKLLLDLDLRIASLNTSYDNSYLQVLVSNRKK